MKQSVVRIANMAATLACAAHRPSNWPIRSQRRHVATIEFNTRVLELLGDAGSRLQRIESSLMAWHSLAPPGLYEPDVSDEVTEMEKFDGLEKRVHSMEALLFQASATDLKVIDEIVAGPQQNRLFSQRQKEYVEKEVEKLAEKIVEIPRMKYIENEVIAEVAKVVEKIVEVPRIEYIETEVVQEAEKLVDKFVEGHCIEHDEKEVFMETEKPIVTTPGVHDATVQCGLECIEVAVQASILRCVSTRADASEFGFIQEKSSYTGPWEPIGKIGLEVGDFVKVAADAKSLNPAIVVEQGLVGIRPKLDEGDPYVFFPEADFHCIGMHWMKKNSLLRPQPSKGTHRQERRGHVSSTEHRHSTGCL